LIFYPMIALSGLFVPVAVFLVVGRVLGGRSGVPRSPEGAGLLEAGLPVMVSVLMAISAVISLVTIVSIYREGGILKRLRATPLRPQTILSAHVLAKLLFTAATLVMMLLAGRRYYPPGLHAPVISFAIALLISTLTILSIGFVVASVVPTARFAQPVGALIFYPMIALSGLFVPIAALPHGLQIAARFLPMTYVVSLLRGIWSGEGWVVHLGDLAALVITGVLCTALSSRIFRWE
jgi:ABC-2 type transport system permease protein